MAIWGCGRMIIWGGRTTTNYTSFGDGGVYDVLTDTWLNPTSIGSGTYHPGGRERACAHWIGDRMITWGGTSSGSIDEGGSYFPPDPAAVTPIEVEVRSLIPVTSEGGSSPAQLQVVLSQPSASLFVVNFQMSGTASVLNGSDYTIAGAGISYGGSTGTVIIPAYTSSVTLEFQPVDDVLDEGVEFATFTLSAGTGYSVGQSNSESFSIVDNDGTGAPDVVVLPSSDMDENGGSSSIVVLVSSIQAAPLTINLELTGTAEFGTDYSVTGATLSGGSGVWVGTLIIPAGNPSATVRIDSLDDSRDEGSGESITLSVVSGTGYSIGTPSSTTLNIVDDDTKSGGKDDGDDEGSCSVSRSAEWQVLLALLSLFPICWLRRRRVT